MLYKNNLFKSTDSELYHANSASSGDNDAAYHPLGRLQEFQRREHGPPYYTTAYPFNPSDK